MARKWKIYTLTGEKLSATYIHLERNGVLLQESKKSKSSYYKTKGFLFWKKTETITKEEDKAFEVGYIPYNQIKYILWEEE